MRALLFLPLVLYLVLPTRNFYWDGIGMAGDIEKHVPLAILLYPSHLIYALWGSWMYAGALALGIKTRALFLMQGANCVLGGLCVPLFYRVLRSMGVAMVGSVAGALIFAFSATWWKFATDANAYVPAIFFLLCAYLLIEDGRHIILAGLAQAIAMMFHELAILFFPLAWMVLRGRRRAEYTLAAIVPVTGAYLIACRTVLGDVSARRLLSWALVHSPDSGFSFNPLRDAALTVRGTLRLMLGGRLDDFPGDLLSKLALAGFAMSAVIFLWMAARRIKAAKWRFPPLPMLVWAACYGAFLFFWMPQNTFYRLFYLPPLIAMGVVAWRWSLAFLVPVLLFWNFAFLIYPDSQPARNAPLRFALEQRDRWPPGTPIVFSRFHPDLWTISYFTPGTSWFGIGLADPDVRTLDRELDYAHSQGQPLWVEADAYNLIASSEEGRRWLTKHDRPAERIEFKDEKHDFRFYCTR